MSGGAGGVSGAGVPGGFVPGPCVMVARWLVTRCPGALCHMCRAGLSQGACVSIFFGPEPLCHGVPGACVMVSRGLVSWWRGGL